MFDRKLRWDVRQLASRLRDDSQQLKNILRTIQILPDALNNITIGYWSEDPRIIDLILDGRIWDTATSFDDPQNSNSEIDVTSRLCHCWDIDGMNGKWLEYINIRVSVDRINYQFTEFTWNRFEAFDVLFILPTIGADGREVAIEYPEFTTIAIADLRDELYGRL